MPSGCFAFRHCDAMKGGHGPTISAFCHNVMTCNFKCPRATELPCDGIMVTGRMPLSHALTRRWQESAGTLERRTPSRTLPGGPLRVSALAPRGCSGWRPVRDSAAGPHAPRRAHPAPARADRPLLAAARLLIARPPPGEGYYSIHGRAVSRPPPGGSESLAFNEVAGPGASGPSPFGLCCCSYGH